MKYQKNSLKKTVVVGTMLVSSAFVFQVSAQTWANPACAPTGCNTPTPINVSGTAQTKAGNFILGGRMEVKNTAPQLWLNENDQTSASLGLWRFLGWEGNLHLYRNLSAAKDFATQSRVISILGANNNIGLGIEPTTKLDVNGQIKIRGGAPGLNKILASDADGLSTWKTKEELGIVGGGTDTSKWTSSGLNIFNKNTGNVGIGMNNPTSLLTVQGNSTKLSEVKIIGTNDTLNNSVGLNVDSARNAHVILDRGNTGQTSYVRHATGGTTDWYAGINARKNNDYQISNTFNGEVGQLTIKKSNGNVGLGKNNPVTKLDVLGSGYFSSSLGVAGKAIVGGAEIKNSVPELWLNESDQASAGLGLWRFQGWEGNFHLYRNTSASKDFSTQSRVISILGANNYVGIGIAPTAKLDVDGQVKIRGGAPGLNKILASDADGLSTWKTPTEIGISGSNWTLTDNNLTNKNTGGNVGVGKAPSDRLDVKGALRITSNQNDEYLRISRETGFGQIQTYNGEDLFINPAGNNTILNQGNGNVGVGTTDPIVKLHVVGSGFFNGSLDVANNLNISDGDVVIGEAPQGPPTATQPRLEVNGNIRFRTGTPAVNKILASTDASGSATWKTPTEIGISGSNWNVSGNNISNKNTGNVGIGILSPTDKLHVVGNTRIAGALISTNNITAMNDMSAGRNMRVGGDLTVVGGNPRPDTILVSTNDSGLAAWKSKTELGIGSSNWNVSGNNISNKNTGSVGIGTDNPSSSLKLDVEGNLGVSNFITANYINARSGGFMMTPEIIITGGEPAPGKVLTATDTQGNSTWQTPAGSVGADDITYASTLIEPPELNWNPFDPDFNIQLFRVLSGSATCPEGFVAVGGGSQLELDGVAGRGANMVGIGVGGNEDNFVAGITVMTTNLTPPASYPNVSDTKKWFCNSGSPVAGDAVLRCYARCIRF